MVAGRGRMIRRALPYLLHTRERRLASAQGVERLGKAKQGHAGGPEALLGGGQRGDERQEVGGWDGVYPARLEAGPQRRIERVALKRRAGDAEANHPKVRVDSK